MLTRSPRAPSSVLGAVAVLVGAAVGAGIFGLPYVISRSGFFIGILYIILLGLVAMVVNLAYGEIVLSTAGVHQFPYYVEKYLGRQWKYIAILSMIIGFYGALLAYLVAVGNLLYHLIGPIFGFSPMSYSVIFLGIMGSIILIGLRVVTGVDKVVLVFTLGLLLLFIIVGWPYLHIEQLLSVNISYLFLPYGVVLFAVTSAAAVPDMKQILQHNRKQLKTAIIIGSIIPLVIYVLFVLMVVGITGEYTTESAVIGIGTVLGPVTLTIGSLFGIIAMSTSFMLLGLVLKEMYQYDLKQPFWMAWLGVVVPLLVILLLKLFTFIEILGLSGALIGGMDGIILIKTHQQLSAHRDRNPEFTISRRPLLHYVAYGVFMLGIGYELYLALTQAL